jgi:hypothetical protein
MLAGFRSGKNWFYSPIGSNRFATSSDPKIRTTDRSFSVSLAFDVAQHVSIPHIRIECYAEPVGGADISGPDISRKYTLLDGDRFSLNLARALCRRAILDFAEHFTSNTLTFNERVAGSSPARLINNLRAIWVGQKSRKLTNGEW